MKSYTLALLAASVSALSEIESAFLGYITQFGKSYQSVADYELRLREFAVKHAYIQEHNQTDSNYKLGHNKFSDWTDAEYKAILNYKPTGGRKVEYEPVQANFPINWIDLGCVNHIKD